MERRCAIRLRGPSPRTRRRRAAAGIDPDVGAAAASARAGRAAPRPAAAAMKGTPRLEKPRATTRKAQAATSPRRSSRSSASSIASPNSIGADEGDLERPQQHLPGGAEEEQQDRGEERRARSRPGARRRRRAGPRWRAGRATRRISSGVAEVIPKTRSSNLLDQHREHHQVLVVGLQQRVDAGSRRSIRSSQVSAKKVSVPGRTPSVTRGRDRQGRGQQQSRRLAGDPLHRGAGVYCRRPAPPAGRLPRDVRAGHLDEPRARGPEAELRRRLLPPLLGRWRPL